MSRDEHINAGEWIRPVVTGFKMCCCDCGLVHKIDFRIVNDCIELRAFRDNRSTGQKRRHIRKIASSAQEHLLPFNIREPAKDRCDYECDLCDHLSCLTDCEKEDDRVA